MLVYADSDPLVTLRSAPDLDVEGTTRLAHTLFPRDTLEEIGRGDLSYTCPPDDELHIGQFPGVAVIAAKEFGIDYPSRLDPHFLKSSRSQLVYLHAMHSVVDWFAFAHWRQGTLVRSLSLSPDSGILEDIGPRLPFEAPYWSGVHPAVAPSDEDEEDPYPFPFHPLDLGEAALAAFFGYQIEGLIDESLLEADTIPLLCFKRKRARWWRWSK